MTRVIAGVAKGRRLKVPAGDRVRPTADRVKEAVFASLQPRLPGARVLDLFAGSGGLGLEAASRGAGWVVMVEKDPRTARVLRDNVAAVGIDDVEIIVGDVASVLDDPGRHSTQEAFGRFDLVLLDPPYDLSSAALRQVLSALVAYLADEAVVIVERATRSGPIDWPPELEADAQRRYGDTTIHRATLASAEVSR